MKRLHRIVLVFCCAGPVSAVAQEQPNPNAVIQNFEERVNRYVRSKVHRPKPTKSADVIEEYQHRFAGRLREARAGSAQGNIFTAPIAAEFRRLIGTTMQGAEATRIRASLQHAEPLHVKGIRINHEYPPWAPLQSTPPSLLLNLPPLPPNLEYRLVGHDLILCDIDANLVVDVIANAIK